MNVRSRMQKNGDRTSNARLELDAVMFADANLRVLFYAGDTDRVANFLEVKRIAKDVRWEGSTAFKARADYLDRVHETV